MMRRWLGVGCAIIVMTHGVAATELYRFGPLGASLSQDSIAAIRALLKPNTTLLAVFARRSQVLPEIWYVDAFLQPSTRGRIGRGRVARLECMPVRNDVCKGWRLQPEEAEYAQVVAEPMPPNGAGVVRSLSERPIRLSGTWSDDELNSLIAYVRGGPQPPEKDGWTSVGISTDYPILDI